MSLNTIDLTHFLIFATAALMEIRENDPRTVTLLSLVACFKIWSIVTFMGATILNSHSAPDWLKIYGGHLG